jgi:hypothetical protein
MKTTLDLSFYDLLASFVLYTGTVSDNNKKNSTSHVNLDTKVQNIYFSTVPVIIKNDNNLTILATLTYTFPIHTTPFECLQGVSSPWKVLLTAIRRCLDVCATPQLDTVTLRPAPSDTVTIRPMSCCGLATQLQLYD